MHQVGLFDILVILIVLLSMVTGFYRGVIKDASSFIRWFGSAVITILLLPYLQPIVAKEVGSLPLSSTISAMIIFAAGFLLITLMLAKTTTQLDIGIDYSINKSLGLAFGLFKGVFIVSIIYISIVGMYRQINGSNDKPKWIEKANTVNLVETISNVTVIMLPSVNLDDFVGEKSNFSKMKRDLISIFSNQDNLAKIGLGENMGENIINMLKLLPEANIQKIHFDHKNIIEKKAIPSNELNRLLLSIRSQFRDAKAKNLIDFEGHQQQRNEEERKEILKEDKGLDEDWQFRDFDKLRNATDDI